MISIKGMDCFQNLCREKLVEWYNKENVCGRPIIGFENTFVLDNEWYFWYNKRN